mmetsp:Transcript_7500/g.17711  ORF Transcript_7500/g.17711 Transcript_7500/m.17711 type:complete len:120 (+) Transcript_7500:36-395(+)
MAVQEARMGSEPADGEVTIKSDTIPDGQVVTEAIDESNVDSSNNQGASLQVPERTQSTASDARPAPPPPTPANWSRPVGGSASGFFAGARLPAGGHGRGRTGVLQIGWTLKCAIVGCDC